MTQFWPGNCTWMKACIAHFRSQIANFVGIEFARGKKAHISKVRKVQLIKNRNKYDFKLSVFISNDEKLFAAIIFILFSIKCNSTDYNFHFNVISILIVKCHISDRTLILIKTKFKDNKSKMISIQSTEFSLKLLLGSNKKRTQHRVCVLFIPNLIQLNLISTCGCSTSFDSHIKECCCLRIEDGSNKCAPHLCWQNIKVIKGLMPFSRLFTPYQANW
jgi:hypothetical protein